MKIISLFNNKSSVDKTTLTYHVAWALAEKGRKVLIIDLDPKCNLTLFAMDEEALHKIWDEEDSFIEEFQNSKENASKSLFQNLNSNPRTIHYLLKPTEEGTGDLEKLPPVYNIGENLDIIPGRLTLHTYEYKISERWTGIYMGEPLSIRTVTKIREIAKAYSQINKYDYILVDTSPSLGALNKVVISTADGVIVPCLPDMFSLYGIRNIGSCLKNWKNEYEIVYSLISDNKMKKFPGKFVQFLGYAIYNANICESETPWGLAQAQYNYVKQIPDIIKEYIPAQIRQPSTPDLISEPIGGQAVMHLHNTFPSMARKYKNPVWRIPLCNLAQEDVAIIRENKQKYIETKNFYSQFADDLENRLGWLD